MGLPQRTEAWRRRVDQKKKTKKNTFFFVFFCLAVKQISITNVFLLSTIFSFISLFLVGSVLLSNKFPSPMFFYSPLYSLSSLFFWLVVQICSDNQYLNIFTDKISSFLFSLCDRQ